MRYLLPLLAGLSLCAPARADEVRGTIRPVQVAELAPLIDGRVQEIAVAEGATVKRGDVLLRMNDDVQQARVALARSAAAAGGEVRQAEVALTEAQAAEARTEAAAARGAATATELSQSRARAAAARAALQTATERREVERQKLAVELANAEQYLLRAPFDGQVTRVEVATGASLGRADRALTVADLSSLEAVIFVPARWIHMLRDGQQVLLTLGDPVQRPVKATLRHIDPLMDGGSARFRCIFAIANPESAMPAGMEARLELAAPVR